MKAKGKILIVEDEVLVAQQIEEELQGFGYEVVSQVPYGEKVSEEVNRYHPDLVLMDITLKGEMNGIEAAHHLKAFSKVPVVYLTAYGDHLMLERAAQTEPFGFLTKPFRPLELNAAVSLGMLRSKFEQALYEKEFLCRNIVEKSSDIIFILGPDKTINFANPAFKYLGYESLELIDEPIETLIESDDMSSILSDLATEGVGPFGTVGLEICIKVNEDSTFSGQVPVLKFSVDSVGLWDVSEEYVFNKGTGKKFLGTLCIGRIMD
jgi:CheY-like chemotaxis protein